MTRDEQIAQLKPGQLVEVRGVGMRVFVDAFGTDGWGRFVLVGQVFGEPKIFPASHIVLPEPPPPPKATPGQKYAHNGSDNPWPRGIGLLSGQLFDRSWMKDVPFDPAVWTPLDEPEAK